MYCWLKITSGYGTSHGDHSTMAPYDAIFSGELTSERSKLSVEKMKILLMRLRVLLSRWMEIPCLLEDGHGDNMVAESKLKKQNKGIHLTKK